MPTPANTVIFSVENDIYSWKDVIAAAIVSGEWIALEQQARSGAASVLHSDASNSASSAAAVEAAGRDFRYARELVTAQSMEAWLNGVGLSAHEWTAYLRRNVLRAGAAYAESLTEAYPIEYNEAVRITLVDAICGPELDAWTHSLAQRAAAHAFLVDSSANLAEVEPPLVSVEQMMPMSILWGIDAAAFQGIAVRLQRLERSMNSFRSAVLTERAVRDFVTNRKLDWVRFDCGIMAFPNVEMAAEAAMMLRDDGERFTGVYQIAAIEPRRAQFFLDDIDESFRDQFLGARSGDVIGPLLIGDEYVLYEIKTKSLPSMNDTDVRLRAESGVLTNALGQQLEQRIRWNVAR